MAEMKVNLCGITLDNPVMAASGTFGYGYEFAELYDINRLGTFSFKGTTASDLRIVLNDDRVGIAEVVLKE